MEKTKTEADKIPTNQSNQKVSSTFNGHEYVDLGLSVMWATCNIGASKPSDYGKYFAWAETNPYSSDYNYEEARLMVITFLIFQAQKTMMQQQLFGEQSGAYRLELNLKS